MTSTYGIAATWWWMGDDVPDEGHPHHAPARALAGLAVGGALPEIELKTFDHADEATAWAWLE